MIAAGAETILTIEYGSQRGPEQWQAEPCERRVRDNLQEFSIICHFDIQLWHAAESRAARTAISSHSENASKSPEKCISCESTFPLAETQL